MAPSALLVADEPDDPDTMDAVASGLRSEGVDVTAVVAPGAARGPLDGVDADVVVLDVHRSGVAGLDRLLQLRQHSPRPAVVLTADDEETVVRALRLGAEEVVRLPVPAAELALRVLAVRRRAGLPPPARRHVDGPLVVDGAARAVTAAGQAVGLTNRELELLVHLLEHAGIARSRDELLHAVWGSSAAWQTPATVTEHVRRIRSKLRDAGVDAGITALRGAGYRYDGASLLTATEDQAGAG